MKSKMSFIKSISMAMLLGWSQFAMVSHAQQEVFETIARVHSDKNAPLALRNQLAILKSEEMFHSARLKTLQEIRSDIEKREILLNEEYRERLLKAEEGAGAPLVDRDTTALLMRNCLVEAQRIRWELASERQPSDSKTQKQLQVEKLNIDALKLEEEKLAYELDVLKKLHQKGAAQETSVKEQTAKLKRAEVNLVEAMNRLESLADETSTDSAIRVAQLRNRADVVAAELDRLKGQRDAFQALETTRVQLDSLRDKSRAIAELETQAQLDQLRQRILIELCEKTLAENAPAAEPAKDSAATPNAK